jgi:hypothetical protein
MDRLSNLMYLPGLPEEKTAQTPFPFIYLLTIIV